jgi:hypothetical protein
MGSDTRPRDFSLPLCVAAVKAFAAIEADRDAFADEEKAMIRLGVARTWSGPFASGWSRCSGIKHADGGYQPSDFAKAVFNRKKEKGIDKGIDPFLEDTRTLWLLHWKLSTHSVNEPLFAWDS